MASTLSNASVVPLTRAAHAVPPDRILFLCGCEKWFYSSKYFVATFYTCRYSKSTLSVFLSLPWELLKAIVEVSLLLHSVMRYSKYVVAVV